MGEWPSDLPGVLLLPSGRRVRGRSLRVPPAPDALPNHTVWLSGAAPEPATEEVRPWTVRWVPWSDFRRPRDSALAAAALREAWQLAARVRVEVACGGGIGRTGTALACLAVLDGVPPDEAVAYVRARYHPRAVETPGQRRYVRRFLTGQGSG